MAPQIKAAQYEPEQPDQRAKGRSVLVPLDARNGFVFLLATTTKTNTDTELLYQVLTEELERLGTEFGKDANPQHRFEQFLGSLNELLAEHVREGRWSLPIERFNAIVGIAVEEQIYLSGTGELTALFLNKQASNRYQILNISRSIQTEQTLPTWEKAFAVVLDGDMHEGDVFCLCNKELQREIPADELNALLTTLPPTSSIEKIRQYFSVKEEVLLIVLKIGERIVQMKEGYARPLADLSVDRMVDNEEETAMLLEDRKPNIGRMVVWVFEKLIRRKMDSRLLQDLRKTQPNWKSFLNKLEQLSRVLLKTTKRSAEKTLDATKQFTEKDTRKKILRQAATASRTFSKKTTDLRQRLIGVSRSTKYLITGVVVAVVILGVSLTWLSRSQAKSAELKAYNQKIADIEDLIERGSGAVIYKDENQARSLYVNAGALIETLPKETEEQQAKITSLHEQIETSMNELRHMVTIPNPALLADMEGLSDGLFGNAMTKNGDQIYVYGSDARVYQLDKAQKLFKVTSTQAGSLLSPVTAASSDSGQIYGLSTEGVLQFKPDAQEQVRLDLSDPKTWIDITAYAGRLYLLEPTGPGEGQIYRYARSGSGFGNPTKWIEAKTTELDKAVSMIIDGNVFVLKSNGSILRYDNGSEVGWKAGVVDPAITGASDIWTDSDSKFLYILEPTTKRLIVFKKDTGEFVVQYRSDTFKDMTDFVVDEKDYTIYVLTGSKVYSIAASHLK